MGDFRYCAPVIRPRFVVLFSLVGLLGGCTDAEPERGSISSRPPAQPRTGAAETASPGPGDTAAPALDPADVQKAWWNWAAGAPSGRNPVEDTTGANCAAGQPRDLWLLAGTFGGSVTRHCAVPPGRTLVAPLVNQMESSKRGCAEFLASATGKMTIDGVTRPSLRWTGTQITVTGVEGNPVSGGPGRFDGYACGLWAVSPPLTPGRHEVTIRGASGAFRVSADYELTVAGPEI
jgi:hypothetical protein